MYQSRMTSKLSVLLAALALAVSSCEAQIYTGGPTYTDVEPVPAAAKAEEVVVPAPVKDEFITQTVYGFLDFTTTIANTVMVFSPQSAPPEGSREAKSSSTIETKPPAEKKIADIQPSKTHKGEGTKKGNTKIVVNSVVEQNVVNQLESTEKAGAAVSTRVEVVTTKSPALSTVVEVQPKLDDVPGVKNNLAEPEYDFLSKQPTEVVDETYKVINLRPSAKSASGAKPRPSARRDKENPTGLVTKLGGTIVKDGLTTVHETNVIGTYINGKYAQVLQSSSRIVNLPVNNNLENGNKIRPTSSQRILKTLGPQQHGKHNKAQQQQQQLEPTSPVQSDEAEQTGLGGGRPGRRHPGSGNGVRPKFRNKIVDEADNGEQQQNRPPGGKNRPGGARPNYKNRPQQAATTTTEVSTSGTRRRTGFRPSNNIANSTPSKQYKNPSKSEQQSSAPTSNPSVKSKLPRTQGRWSYKTTPKPRIQIRKQAGDDEPKPQGQQQVVTVEQNVATSSSPVVNGNPPPQANVDEQVPLSQRKIQETDFDGELDESESEDVNISVQQQQQQQQPLEAGTPQPTERILPIETINVEISTPADFNDIYFEIATIKSPYEFQVGSSRNTRFVTVTSTLKKSFATAEPTPSSASPTEPLTENILANTGAAYETSLPLDSSIATLPAITLEPSQATPPLETITETFSTTQTLLKTHLLPVMAANGNTTTRITLVQTYNIARIVTATKTLPPAELFQFVPSKTLNEFNSKLDEAGSELHLELDFGDDERDDEDVPKRIVAPSTDLDSDLDIFKSINPTSKLRNEISAPSNAQLPLAEPPMSKEQAQQLALLKLLGQQQQQQQQQPQIITTSRPVVVLETIYDSHVIPLVNGGNTIFSTLSRPVATVPRTSYEYGTSTLAPPIPLPQVPPQVPQLPLFPQAQPQFTVTSAPIVQQTVATVSDSRVLKLTFGAKTAYTTLFSTRLMPTEITTYLTSTIALQPTVPSFPGYYPPPVGFPGYPFVG